MRLPFGAAQVLGHGSLDSGQAEDSFRVMWGHAVPEAPEIFERGVTLSVEEGMLQAVRFVASKTVCGIYHMPRLEPLALAHHRYEWIFLAFPGNPVVPADVGAGERFITNIKLRLECEGMTRGVRSQSELNGNALKRIKVDPIRIDIFKKLRKSNPSRRSLFSRACVPRNEREENLDSVAVKLLNHLTNRGNAAREIAQQIELIAVVNAEVGIEVPNQDGIDRTNATFRVVQKTVHRVYACFGVVKRAIPDERLDLGENLLGPGQLWPLVLGIIVAETDQLAGTPRFKAREPRSRIRRALWPREEDFRRGRLGKVHNPRRRDERMPGFPFIGKNN